MDGEYASLFEGGDEDDAFFRAEIPTLPVKMMRDLVDRYIARINAHPSDPEEWVRFKWEIVKYEAKWHLSARLFSWGSKEGRFTIGIDHRLLDNRTSRYFQVLMAFDDVWFGGDDKVVDFWGPIYDALGLAD